MIIEKSHYDNCGYDGLTGNQFILDIGQNKS